MKKQKRIYAYIITAIMAINSFQSVVCAVDVYADESLVNVGTPTDSNMENEDVVVCFYGNGEATGEMESVVVMDPLQGILVPENRFDLKGHTFNCWNTEPDGTGASYYPGDTLKVPEGLKELKLYAQWEAVAYRILFDGNGATEGYMGSMKCYYNIESILKESTFEKEGYRFIGWNTNPDGTGDNYSDGASVINLSDNNNDIRKLYAQWELASYKIEYINGHNNKENRTSYKANTTTFALKTPTWTGHTFQGWFSDSKYTKKVTRINKGTVGDKTFYAKWTTNKYTIKYNGNGATSGTVKNKTCTYGKTYNVAKNAYKRTGYTFTGWNTKKDGSGTKYKANQEITNLRKADGSVVNLYAQWKVNKYIIVFRPNGGSGDMKNKYCKYDTKYTLPANNFSRDGYVFVGWSTSENGNTKYKNKASVSKLRSGDGATITLYAKWKPKKASIASVKKSSYASNVITISSQKCKGFEIYRSTSLNGNYTLIKTTSSTTYQDNSVSSGVTYYYKVRAYVTNGSQKIYGDYSTAKCVTTAKKPSFTASYLPVGSRTWLSSVCITNNGTESIYVDSDSIFKVYPSYIYRKSGFYFQGHSKGGTVSPGAKTSILIETDKSLAFYDIPSVAFVFNYDECEYVVECDYEGNVSFVSK